MAAGHSTWRTRAYPQPPSTPFRHVGQPISPAKSRDSTQAKSTSTVTISACEHYSAAPSEPTKTFAGCRAPISYLVTLMVNTSPSNRQIRPTGLSATPVANPHPVVVTQRDGQHPFSLVSAPVES